MKIALLDSNFILTCVKQKIDFFEDLKFMGLKILIPEQVIKEIKNVAKSRKKLHFREDAKLALKILGKNKFQKADIGEGYVDRNIKNYADENKEILVATLDSELKKKLRNRKIVIRGKKKLEII